MTQADLDALPDVTPGFGQKIEIRDGKRVAVPVLEKAGVALYHEPDDPIATTDMWGQNWLLGRNSAGVLCKRRIS